MQKNNQNNQYLTSTNHPPPVMHHTTTVFVNLPAHPPSSSSFPKMSVPASFISVCERYACNRPTEDDKAILHSLSTGTPLPPSIRPLDYGFNSDTCLPDDPAPFHDTKNRIRALAHASRQKAQLAALHDLIARNSSAPKFASFPNTLSAYPLQSGVKQAIRTALSAACAVEWRVSPLLLLGGERFIDAVRAVGFDVLFDGEIPEVVFRLEQGNDYLLLWKMLAIRDGDTLPAGDVTILAPRKTACGSCLVRAFLRIV